MVRDVTLGQYFPAKSVIHRLDPRIKVILRPFYLLYLSLLRATLPDYFS